jgi:hypothetical protein
MQFFDLVMIEFQTYTCKYCGKDLTVDEFKRIDVMTLKGQYEYTYCGDSHKCMQKHIRDVFPNIPEHICYGNGCLQ